MRNSEWGAVAYLGHSQYGRNGSEVQINNNSNGITGAAGYAVSSSSSSVLNVATSTATTGTFPYNNTHRGVLASTTGNVYGVYDMSGGRGQFVAGVLRSYDTQYGPSNEMAYDIMGSISDVLIGWEKEDLLYYYFDQFSRTSVNLEEWQGWAIEALNYQANEGTKGNAIFETSSNNGDDYYYNWFSDYGKFMDDSDEGVRHHLLVRGGGYNKTSGAGMFAFDSMYYCNGAYSYRPVIAKLF